MIGALLMVFFYAFLGRVEESVNERDLLEVQLRHSQRGEAVGRLAGGIAHAFNNLLTGIQGFTELAIDNLDSRPKALENLGYVRDGADRAARVVSKLLAFSRERPIESVVLDLNELVREMSHMMDGIVGDDITLRFGADSDVGVVRADPALIEQVLLDLVVNARDAMPHGGEIEIRTRRVVLTEDLKPVGVDLPGRDYASIVVSDTGVGIPEENQARIFEPFFTTKEVGKGSGLGLSTVQGIVKQHEGLITVDSSLGAGTRFEVYLPATDEPLPASRTAVEEKPELVSRGERILVVDDENQVRKVVVKMLERQNYHVQSASNSAEAEVVAGSTDAFELLVTDVVMPGDSGPMLYRRLLESNPDLKVLYMSGYLGADTSEQGVLAEGVEFLNKPFSMGDLAHHVRLVLDIEESSVRFGSIDRVRTT